MTPEQDPSCGRGFLKYLFLVGGAAIVLLAGTFWWGRFSVDGTSAMRLPGLSRAGQSGVSSPAAQSGAVALPVAAVMTPAGVAGTPDGLSAARADAPRTRFAAVARLMLPSVVNVSATSMRLPENVPPPPPGVSGTPAPQQQGANPNPGLQFADPLSGVTTESIGSGVVVTEDGYVLTNYHVVEKSKHIYVTLFDAQGNNNQVLPAEVVTLDARRDLALLKVDPEMPLQPVAFGDSSQANVGDPVLAIGSPFGLDQTVSQGIISGKRKAINIGGVLHRGLIQTDAAINRGNSGGPLVDGNGYVVGINTAIFTTTNAFAGVGFAVPANAAREFLSETLRLPAVTPNLPTLASAAGGAHIAARPPPPIQANAVAPHGDRGPCTNCHAILPAAPGALPAAFNPPGPPGKDGGWHRNRADAWYMFDPSGAVGVAPGAVTTGTAAGDGGATAVAVPAPGANEELLAAGHLRATFGLSATLLNMPGAGGQQRPFSAPKGVVVEAIQPGSVADQAGLRPGDVIHKVEGRWVESLALLLQRLTEAKPGDEVRFAIANTGGRRSVYMRMPSRGEGGGGGVAPVAGMPPASIAQAQNVAMTALNAPVGARQWGNAAPPPAAASAAAAAVPTEFEWMGVELIPTRPGAIGARGGTVKEVTAGSPAARGGLRVGDVVLAINGTPTPDAAALDRAIKAAAGRQWTLLEIERNGARMFSKIQ
ncbi:MAG: trypsin-like peptidase domain-containing protein [Magnetococcales bacterium]|nr:trypsin-like peptidase domain-containing protein [Magnetococcales bacterium]